MAGRHGAAASFERPERQNEYFVPGDGISREVIQADICRYLGNDALGRQGYLIRAYRNLTSEMITDLKSDSARWEADVARRADSGYPRGTADVQGSNVARSPNAPLVTYASSNIHEMRQQGGPSPPPPYNAGTGNYMDAFAPPAPFVTQAPPGYPQTTYSAPQGQYAPPNPYVAPPNPYTGPAVPSVTTGSDMHGYTYANTNAPGYPYDNGRGTAPRYSGQVPGYDDSEYSPNTSASVPYTATTTTTTAPDTRITMGDTRYQAAEPTYDHRTQATRPQQPRERDTHRRTAR
ncbi:hypothetical protein V8E54_010203 [Elaphomyces granulatus]